MKIPNRAVTDAHVDERRLPPAVQEALGLFAALERGAAGVRTELGRTEQLGLPEEVRAARAQLERLKARFAAPTVLTTQREPVPWDSDV